MQSLRRDQMDELWDRYWTEMRREWFKLEVLQDYSGEDDGPSLRAWLKGNKQIALDLLKVDSEPEFTVQCRQKTDEGVDLLRIHVIERPLTPYMEWEIEFYRRVSRPLRSERVFVIDRAAVSRLDLPAGDLMMFDDDRAIVNSYSPNGRLAGSDFYDSRDDLTHFLRLKKALKTSPGLRPIAGLS